MKCAGDVTPGGREVPAGPFFREEQRVSGFSTLYKIPFILSSYLKDKVVVCPSWAFSFTRGIGARPFKAQACFFLPALIA